MTKSVMIVDDHPAIRVAIRALFHKATNFQLFTNQLMAVKPWKH